MSHDQESQKAISKCVNLHITDQMLRWETQNKGIQRFNSHASMPELIKWAIVNVIFKATKKLMEIKYVLNTNDETRESEFYVR